MVPGEENAAFVTTPDADRLRASPRLFDDPLLDKLSRVHWSMPLFVYLPVVALLAVVGLRALPVVSVLGATILGYVIWTLVEYFGHRFLFHLEFPGAFGARIHFLIHGVHHVHPNDPLRLVMPVLLSGPIVLAAYAIIGLLFGRPWLYPIEMGFLIGYLAYDMTHFYVHHVQPTTRLGLTLRRLHMMHHFRDSDRGFGVSAPWWDYVFRTAHVPPPRRSSSGSAD